MNTVERIKKTCKENKIPIYKLERDLGYSNGYIGGLKKGSVPDDRLRDIANYLGTSTDYLMYGDEKDDIQAKFNTGMTLSQFVANESRAYLLELMKDFNDQEIKQMIDYAQYRKQMRQEIGKDM